MSDPASASGTTESTVSLRPSLPPGWLSRHAWVTYLLPFIVYMILGSWEPSPPGTPADSSIALIHHKLGIDYQHYPLVYTCKLCIVALCMLAVLPGYRTFHFRVSWLAPVVGIVGVIAWVGICDWDLEKKLLAPLGLDAFLDFGVRSGFNPLEQLADQGWWAYGFLGIRMVGLALIVPVIEEFFLRGFVMRFLVSEKWWAVPFGTVNRAALVAGTAVPMLMHPAELLAAFVWFSGVSWLMLKTKNIWDCVVAHAVTNLLLGVYVVATGSWELM